MKFKARVKRDVTFLRNALRTLRWVRPIKAASQNLACDDVEAAVDKWPARRAITFEGKTITYAEFDQMANRYANWAKAQGLRRGQTVAVFLPNRLEYIPIWYGLTKVGVVAALINNNLAGAALAHCVNIAEAAHVIVDDETTGALEAVAAQIKRPVKVWTLGMVRSGQRDLPQALKSVSPLRPNRKEVRGGMTAKDVALYIFTSGTTGLPKAAKMTHMRVQLYMRGFAGSTGAVESDRIYITLPLYHATGGLCAVGAALLTGASIVLRKKFSASQFWDDIVAEDCSMFVYIGELCRYLINQPEHPLERKHHLRQAFGNGLRPDVWEEMQPRFAIPFILEFYGATEGNVSMFNFDGRPGAIGRVPRWLAWRFNARLVKFDLEKEEPVRGPDGLCRPCQPGEIGECLGEIGTDVRNVFVGYADKAATEKKVLRNVFKKGDAWFRTGDLMRQDEDGYFYFVDRIGDTFRWKGENVSTSEVAERLAHVPGVEEVNVYGVPVGRLDGKAGMASLVVDETFSMDELAAFVDRELPTYARPMFVRIQPQIETTGTFKYRKMDLVADGFDPARVKDPIYFRNPDKKAYTKLTKASHEKILDGGYRL
ncbi:MAG TPA: long-chain-acyl-CoA synthetase [Caulobacteraceae bacterium]